MKLGKKGIIAIIAGVTLPIGGVAGYLVVDNLPGPSGSPNPGHCGKNPSYDGSGNDESTRTELRDENCNSYTLEFTETTYEYQYRIYTSQGLLVFSDLSNKSVQYFSQPVDVLSLKVSIHSIASKSAGYEYLAFEYRRPDPGSGSHQYIIVALNNGTAKEVASIGGRGTSFYRADDKPLANYVVKANTVTFFTWGGGEFGGKRTYSQIRLTLHEDTYTAKEIPYFYKVEGAGAK
ncbi:MAG: hypothetical protein LBE83_07535 [Propionibacteriaceae bacterium]|jgi:hypothetical protein|nr:hypothetical protein [Propionibacteriaceae bacterium]